MSKQAISDEGNALEQLLRVVHPAISIVTVQSAFSLVVLLVLGSLCDIIGVGWGYEKYILGQSSMVGGWIGAAYYFKRIRSVAK